MRSVIRAKALISIDAVEETKRMESALDFVYLR